MVVMWDSRSGTNIYLKQHWKGVLWIFYVIRKEHLQSILFPLPSFRISAISTKQPTVNSRWSHSEPINEIALRILRKSHRNMTINKKWRNVSKGSTSDHWIFLEDTLFSIISSEASIHFYSFECIYFWVFCFVLCFLLAINDRQ